MGIRKDAAKLIGILYGKYLEDPFMVNLSEKLAKGLGWEINRVLRAVLYLSDNSMIKTEGAGHMIMGLYPKGIETVEDEKKFETEFGINLGVFSFKWKRK